MHTALIKEGGTEGGVWITSVHSWGHTHYNIRFNISRWDRQKKISEILDSHYQAVPIIMLDEPIA